jgi:hypothetical protein
MEENYTSKDVEDIVLLLKNNIVIIQGGQSWRRYLRSYTMVLDLVVQFIQSTRRYRNYAKKQNNV